MILIELHPFRIGAGDETRRPISEAGDLLLPFGLDGRGRHDQDARNPLLPREDLAGGDGLQRLAEPHLVGEQGPFVTGEMRGAFPLIGQERQLDDIEARAAGVR